MTPNTDTNSSEALTPNTGEQTDMTTDFKPDAIAQHFADASARVEAAETARDQAVASAGLLSTEVTRLTAQLAARQERVDEVIADRNHAHTELDYYKGRCRELETRIHAIETACNDAVRFVSPRTPIALEISPAASPSPSEGIQAEAA